MIKPPSDGLAVHGISPVRGNLKHSGTPLKFRRKTSRKDQATGICVSLNAKLLLFHFAKFYNMTFTVLIQLY